MRIGIFKLPLQNTSRRVAVCRALFKTVVLFHSLIVKVFSIDNKKNFIYVRKRGRELSSFKRSQRFSASRGMPYITARVECACLFIVGRNFYPRQDSFRSGDLIWPHNKQKIFRSKHTIPCQNVKYRMFRKKSLCKIHNIRNYFIVPISPIGSKFKAVARLFAALALALAVFFDMAISCSIGVILCMSSVRYNKNLYILKQP